MTEYKIKRTLEDLKAAEAACEAADMRYEDIRRQLLLTMKCFIKDRDDSSKLKQDTVDCHFGDEGYLYIGHFSHEMIPLDEAKRLRDWLNRMLQEID